MARARILNVECELVYVAHSLNDSKPEAMLPGVGLAMAGRPAPGWARVVHEVAGNLTR